MDRNKQNVWQTLKTYLFASNRKYSRSRHLGKGRYGSVSLYKHNGTNTKVAIKKIPKANITLDLLDPLDKTKLMEIEVMKSLDHRHLIKFCGWEKNEKCVKIVMEYPGKGETIQSFINRRFYFTENTAALLLKQLASGIAYMHRQGFIHGDIKPDNLYITKAGLLKVLDFGTSVRANDLCTDRPYGSERFISPEGLASPCDRIYNVNSVDSWAIGVTLYLMLTHEYPQIYSFDKGAVRFICPRVCSIDLSLLMERMLEGCPIARINPWEIENHEWLRGRSLEHSSWDKDKGFCKTFD